MSGRNAKSEVRAPKALQLRIRQDEAETDAWGRALVDPALTAASVIDAYKGNLFNDASLVGSMEQIKDVTARVRGGDLSDIEGMLIGQATALQTLFVSLSRRAQAQDMQRNLETFLGLALKAQSASRATLSALVDLKFPRTTVIAKQANVAGGMQQVNNQAGWEQSTPACKRAGSAEDQQTKILRNDDGSWMDPGAASTPGRADQELAAVGADDRPKDGRRKGARRP